MTEKVSATHRMNLQNPQNSPHPDNLSRTQAAREARAQSRKWRQEHTEVIDGVTIRPAIGKTNGAENIGWEMHRAGQDPWFVMTREQAIAAIPRFLLRGKA